MASMSAADRRAQRWRGLDRLHAAVLSALEGALQTKFQVSVNEYEILAALAEAEGGYARMQRLAEAVGLPQSTTSRLVARLEDTGRLQRYLCEADRRGVFTQITTAGRALRSRAAIAYDAVLREFDALAEGPHTSGQKQPRQR